MRPRAFADLCTLSEPDFFKELAEGLRHIARNVAAIDADSQRLVEANRGRGARILHAFAAEEAGKYLILLDAARCPPLPPGRFSAQFRKANSHLAKGLYSGANDIRPIDFAEVKRWVERESKEFYLDGPTGYDWVFRNHLTHSRENTLYVDYVEAEGTHYWDVPSVLDENIALLPPSRSAVLIVQALADAGFGSAASLQAIATVWRPVAMRDDFDIHELRRLNIATLTELSLLGLLTEQPDIVYSHIATHWFFPLHDLPLRSLEVTPAELKAERGR